MESKRAVRLATGDEIDELLWTDPVRGFDTAKQVVRALRRHPDPCVRARAWSRLGAALRTLGDRSQADDAFRKAAQLCDCGRCRPDRLRRLAYLRTYQGLPRSGIELARAAVAAFGGDRHGAARARLALAFAEQAAGYAERSIESARRALADLPARDLLYTSAAISSISTVTLRVSADEATMRKLLADLDRLRRRWPRSGRYRAARARVRMLRAIIRHRLGRIRPADLRATLGQVQGTMIEIGAIPDAVEITADTAEICAEMRREDLVAHTLQAMLEALPSSLPRHVAMALRKLHRSLGAVDRGEILRAAAELRASVALCPSPGL